MGRNGAGLFRLSIQLDFCLVVSSYGVVSLRQSNLSVRDFLSLPIDSFFRLSSYSSLSPSTFFPLFIPFFSFGRLYSESKIYQKVVFLLVFFRTCSPLALSPTTKMMAFNSAFVFAESKNRLFLLTSIIAVSLVCGAYFVGDTFIAKEYKGKLARWGLIHTMQNTKPTGCKSQCRPSGSEALPEGIVVKTSNLEMRPLWDSDVNNRISKPSLNLLAMAVGIKQKAIVNRIIEKFSASNFVVMLFHYDGLVDGWKDLAWTNRAIHVSAINQTKWWFAKRFLHPDIVAEYNYIFLWDEDLGVENFDPKKYLSIVKEEGLEISQPALDPRKSEVHHPLTVRRSGSKVHRRYYKFKGNGRCDDHSTSPPCIGWVEMMAPVFSNNAWRCVWHMIQNDLIHAWGLDRQLGYCAQGDRMRNVGVVDSEYIVHLGLPTLGGSNGNAVSSNAPAHPPSSLNVQAPSNSHGDSARAKVRMQSYIEMKIFGERWKDAVKNDKCWIDLYGKQANQTGH